MSGALVWFRNDLRLRNNPALREAIQYAPPHKSQVVALIMAAPWEWREIHRWGLPKADYYVRSAQSLQIALAGHGISTVIHYPKCTDYEKYWDTLATDLVNICRTRKCSAVFMNIEYEAAAGERDAIVVKRLEDAGILYHATHDQCAVEVGKILTKSGTPYKIFSQFKKTWAAHIGEHGLDIAESVLQTTKQLDFKDDLRNINLGFDGKDYCDLNLGAVRKGFPAGEEEAHRRLHEFLKSKASSYHEDRNQDGCTSRLSAPLAVGAISLRECLIAACSANDGKLLTGSPGLSSWINEFCWRDFYRHLLFHFPHIGRYRSFRNEYEDLAWRGWPAGEDTAAEADFEKWCKGMTGFPLVDAAMRQLRQEGWMPNRMRMVVAMFLTKDLLIHWRRGEAHFQQHLADYDFASNNGGWQWSASTGTDAQPYFRIFNPLLQSEKFDPEGEFIRKNVKELRKVEGNAVHDPYKRMNKAEFDKLGYPKPMVAHAEAREKVLQLFSKTASKGKREGSDE